MGKMSRAVDYFFLNKPFMKDEPCADQGYLKDEKDSLFFAITDIAGHGDSAHELSLVVKKYFEKNFKENPVDLMGGLHILLKRTRGAVGLAGQLNKKTGAVEYVGIGNISLRKLGKTNTRTISNEGIIGYVIRTPKIQRLELAPDEVLLLCTDGIIDHFELSECPAGLLKKDARRIAETVMKHFYRGDDDAGCIAIRFKID